MFNKDILRLHKKAVKFKMNDTDIVFYNHYLLGRLSCTVSYVKELFKLLSK